MARKPRLKLPVDHPVMVRVAANRLGRDAKCALPGCGGALRITTRRGYEVEVCVKCERRLVLWSSLETRLKAALARVAVLEAPPPSSAATDEQDTPAVAALPVVTPAAPPTRMRRGMLTGEIVRVLGAARQPLGSVDIQKRLAVAASISAVSAMLHYLVHTRNLARATPRRIGKRVRFFYSLRRATS